MRLRHLALVVALALLALGAGRAALAHAVLLGSEPADGTVLAQAPQELRLRFNEPVRVLALRIHDASGGSPPTTEPASADGEVGLAFTAPLAPGPYLASWRVLSQDGHIVAGTIAFAVGTADAGALVHDAPGDPLATAAPIVRALRLLALLAALGAGAYLLLLAPPAGAERSIRRGALAAAAVAGVLILLELAIGGARLLGEGWVVVPAPSTWRLALDAGIADGLAAQLGAVALLALGLLLRRRGARTVLVALAALLGAGGFALAGHTAAAPPRALAMPVLALHTLLALFWLGSLAPLLVVLRRGDQAAAQLGRFSRLAVPALPLLLGLGLLLAALQLRGLEPLIASDYGLRLLVKLALVGGLLALAALNRLVLTPALAAGRPGTRRRLGQSIGAELVLMAGVVAVTASLAETVPPRALAGHEAHAHHDHAAGFATHAATPGAHVLIDLEPARPGRNRLRLHFSDPGGRDLTPREVEVRLALPEAGIEPLRREAAPHPGGGFVLETDDLVLPGRWQLRVDALIDDFTKVIFRAELPIL